MSNFFQKCARRVGKILMNHKFCIVSKNLMYWSHWISPYLSLVGRKTSKIIHFCDKRAWKVQITLSPICHIMDVFLKRDFSELNPQISQKLKLKVYLSGKVKEVELGNSVCQLNQTRSKCADTEKNGENRWWSQPKGKHIEQQKLSTTIICTKHLSKF